MFICQRSCWREKQVLFRELPHLREAVLYFFFFFMISALSAAISLAAGRKRRPVCVRSVIRNFKPTSLHIQVVFNDRFRPVAPRHSIVLSLYW